MKKEPLGAAVVGLGVGEDHAIAYSGNERCRLRLLYDIDCERSKTAALRLGHVKIAKSFEAVLEDESVEVVSIASYDDCHAKEVLGVLRSGKHVFVEKPLCCSAEELGAIKRTWEKNSQLQLVSNLVLRAAPLYVWLRKAIESGEFGQIYAFDGDYLYGRLEKITQGWRNAVEDYSVLRGGGIHLLDLMLWLIGQKPVSVFAIGNRICSSGTEFRYDDFVTATYCFGSGLVGRITANFGCVHRHQHVVRIFGTKKTFIYDDQGARLHKHRDPSIPETRLDLQPLPHSKGDLIPGFLDAILDGKDGKTETQHEFDVMSCCLAADASLASSRTVEITYL